MDLPGIRGGRLSLLVPYHGSSCKVLQGYLAQKTPPRTTPLATRELSEDTRC